MPQDIVVSTADVRKVKACLTALSKLLDTDPYIQKNTKIASRKFLKDSAVVLNRWLQLELFSVDQVSRKPPTR